MKILALCLLGGFGFFIYWKLAGLTSFKVAICVFLLFWINNIMVSINKEAQAEDES